MTEVQFMSERHDEPIMEDLSLRTRRTSYRDDLSVLTVSGELDLGTVPHLAEALGGEMPPVLVVDLTRVTFLGVAGMRVLVAAAERAHRERRCLGLVANGPIALRVLRMSGVAASIPTFGTLSDAVRELAPRPSG